MQFDVITLFPEMFAALTASGITRRAYEQQKFGLSLWNPRDFTTDNHRTVDDRPYGGGPGMVMMAAPLEAAIHASRNRQQQLGMPRPRTIYLSPQGAPLNHDRVMQLSQEQGLVLLEQKKIYPVQDHLNQHQILIEMQCRYRVLDRILKDILVSLIVHLNQDLYFLKIGRAHV